MWFVCTVGRLAEIHPLFEALFVTPILALIEGNEASEPARISGSARGPRGMYVRLRLGLGSGSGLGLWLG